MTSEGAVVSGANGLPAVTTRSNLVVIAKGETTPSDRSVEKRRLRKHFVLNVIRESGPLSRAEIAKQSGLNLPSVSSLVDELVSDELVIEQQARPSLRGRRPIPVYLKDDAASVLGIDIGKNSTTALLVNLRAKQIATLERPSPSLSSAEEYTAWALEVADQILSQASSFMPPLCGIGIAVPGLLSSADDQATLPASTIDGVRPVATLPVEPLQEALTAAYGVEVLVDNDARIQVPGAKWFSEAGGKFDNYVVISVGEGLGMGVMVNGQVLRGGRGFAGELGHIPLGRPGIPCHCGQTGCLENTASGGALVSMAAERGIPVNDVGDLAQIAREGNEQARQVFSEFANALGRGIGTVLNLFNPDAVILTGRVSRAADVFFDEMRQSIKEHALTASLEPTVIVLEEGRKNLASLGAAAIVLNQIFYSSQVSYEEVI